MADKKVVLGVMLVVGILLVGLLSAYLIPIMVGAFQDDISSDTYNQTEGETIAVTGDINATLDSVDDTEDTIDVTVDATDSGESSQITDLGEGSNETVTVNDADVDVTNNEVTSAESASVTYEYPQGYSWSAGTLALYVILPLLFILSVALFVVGWAVSQGQNL